MNQRELQNHSPALHGDRGSGDTTVTPGGTLEQAELWTPLIHPQETRQGDIPSLAQLLPNREPSPGTRTALGEESRAGLHQEAERAGRWKPALP